MPKAAEEPLRARGGATSLLAAACFTRAATWKERPLKQPCATVALLSTAVRGRGEGEEEEGAATAELLLPEEAGA
jgi:hypothetical protein